MRACRLVSSITGLVLAVLFATTEAIAASADITLIHGFRIWMGILIVVTVVTIIGTAILDNQHCILDRLDAIETRRSPESRAERDYTQMRSQIRTTGNITAIYPEE